MDPSASCMEVSGGRIEELPLFSGVSEGCLGMLLAYWDRFLLIALLKLIWVRGIYEGHRSRHLDVCKNLLRSSHVTVYDALVKLGCSKAS